MLIGAIMLWSVDTFHFTIGLEKPHFYWLCYEPQSHNQTAAVWRDDEVSAMEPGIGLASTETTTASADSKMANGWGHDRDSSAASSEAEELLVKETAIDRAVASNEAAAINATASARPDSVASDRTMASWSRPWGSPAPSLNTPPQQHRAPSQAAGRKALANQPRRAWGSGRVQDEEDEQDAVEREWVQLESSGEEMETAAAASSLAKKAGAKVGRKHGRQPRDDQHKPLLSDQSSDGDL